MNVRKYFIIVYMCVFFFKDPSTRCTNNLDGPWNQTTMLLPVLLPGATGFLRSFAPILLFLCFYTLSFSSSIKKKKRRH
uniref:Uncharacterized protein n=1 Tax=Lepeophtheirus salmonis TaxID=72036 RepID=A0A0K2ULT8_LEPSM